MMHCAFLLFFIGIVANQRSIRATPLDDYVNKPDPTYAWNLVSTTPTDKSTVYILNLTSQTWMDQAFSSRPIWRHYMVVTVPKVLQRPNFALLDLGGGRNTDGIPKSTSSRVAEVSGSVNVELLQIPNQAISFPADPTHASRTEDDIIAWTWRVFLESNCSNPEVLLQLPMTKAAVRAMDATQEFLRQKQIQVPEKFVVTGESKRGWTTWLTAAVDNKRVIAAMPIVFDLLNMPKSMMSMYQSLTGWTFTFAPYYKANITGYLTTPQYQTLSDIVDPYAYFDRYRNTKIFQIQAADDQFFLLDNENFFWNDLQTATGGSFLKRIPNVGHMISGYEASLESFYIGACDNTVLPSMTWTRTTNATHGQIVATVSTANGRPKPIGVTVYQARTVNGTKRDFRLNVLDPKTQRIIDNPIRWYQQKNIDTTTSGDSIIYTYTTPVPPDSHWDGAFLQATFSGPAGTTTNLDLTTETLIVPNTYPVGPCSGAACVGTLV